MLRRIDAMPAGTIGFEAVGEVEDDDWEDVVEPVLLEEVAQGRKLRLLYLVGTRVGKIEADAIKEGAEFRARHGPAYTRVAVVSDEDWLMPALRVLSVLVPGRTRGFPVSDLEAAKAWVAEDDES